MSKFFDDTIFFSVVFKDEYVPSEEHITGIEEALGGKFKGTATQGGGGVYLDFETESNYIRVFLDSERCVMGLISKRAKGIKPESKCVEELKELFASLLASDTLPHSYAELNLELKGYYAPSPEDKKKNKALALALARQLLPRRSDISQVKTFTIEMQYESELGAKTVTYSLSKNRNTEIMALNAEIEFSVVAEPRRRLNLTKAIDYFTKVDPVSELNNEYEALRELEE